MIYSENDLIIPTLNILYRNPEGVDTSTLIKFLINDLAPEGEDLVILSNRSDTKFSQKVRNLKSHNTLQKKGFSIFDEGKFRITQKGRDFLLSNSTNYSFLLTNGFSEEQRNTVINKNFEDFISEGGVMFRNNVKTYKRSKKLVDYAKEKYRKGDDIYCESCNFSFLKYYGKHGEGFIEIHHLAPIFMNDETNGELEELVKNVVPLCANCHRMVHRKSNNILSLTQLQSMINSSLLFQW